jgi:hypothetical protein
MWTSSSHYAAVCGYGWLLFVFPGQPHDSRYKTVGLVADAVGSVRGGMEADVQDGWTSRAADARTLYRLLFRGLYAPTTRYCARRTRYAQHAPHAYPRRRRSSASPFQLLCYVYHSLW